VAKGFGIFLTALILVSLALSSFEVYGYYQANDLQTHLAGRKTVPVKMLGYADIVLYNARIVAQDGKAIPAEALAMKSGELLLIGNNGQMEALMGPKTEQIDLKGGTVKLTVQLVGVPALPKDAGYVPQTFTVAISPGGVTSVDFYLVQSGVPIPEYPYATIALISALAVSLYILRRSRHR